MSCNAIRPYYDAVWSDLDKIQHIVIHCIMIQWNKYDAMQYGTDSSLLFLLFRKSAMLAYILSCDSQDSPRSL